MAGEKVVPPKPEGQKKKEARDAKIADALKQLRAKRRDENKAKRASALKRAQDYEAAYKKATCAEIAARRNVALYLFRPKPPVKSTYPPNPDLPLSLESEVLTNSTPRSSES